MTILHYTEASGGLPNSGRLSGTNGDLVGILDVVLVAAGWAIEYTSGNARVYRPATGNRFRLHVNDDSATSGDARLAVVRGCENASAATTLVDPFPTVALVGNTTCNWLKSSLANTTGRAFDIYVSSTWIFFAVNFSGASNIWEWHFFGDCPSNIPGDTYNTLCITRANASVGAAVGYAVGNTAGQGLGKLWWARSYDGTVKSTQSAVWYATTNLGGMASYPAMKVGPTIKIDQRKAVLCDTGSTSATPSGSVGIPERAFLPNIRIPLHSASGAINARDTWTDTSYNASSSFILFSLASNSNSVIVEASDTWVKPSG